MIVGFYGRIYAENAKIPLESFYLWEKRAVAAINRLTARDITESPDENAKMCICEVAELLYERCKTSGIVAENNDGYSVKFDNSSLDAKICEIVQKWLCRSGLLYRGDVL